MHAARRQLQSDGLSLPAFFALQAQTGLIARVLDLALDEDTGNYLQHAALDAGSASGSAGSHPQFIGDMTSSACDLSNKQLHAHVVPRTLGPHSVVAGIALIEVLVRTHFPRISFTEHLADGSLMTSHSPVLSIKGPARDCLLLERTMLNFLGRLSGVATLTRTYVHAARVGAPASCTPAQICDTRKTTPGLRVLEKYAVRCGGGVSHRMGLHDALLIKDNHLAHVPITELAAFVLAAARRAKELAQGRLLFAEVEVDSEAQLRALLTLPPGTIDVVLLDNMTAPQLRACSDLRDAKQPALLLEASGGVNLSTIASIAQSGVDRVSIGALTHSAVQVDFGLDAAKT